MDYLLVALSHEDPASKAKKRKIVPPKPKAGERGARPYSNADLDALVATSHSFPSQALVTLISPSHNKIQSWPKLKTCLIKLKDTLTNWHRRKGFPALLFVTEFDSHENAFVAAHFHIGFAQPLTEDQVSAFRQWWLDLMGVQNNAGTLFHYTSKGGGVRLQEYLAKDIKGQSYLKYPASWLPKRVECRLWFCVGIKRKSSKEGAKIRSRQGIRRRRFDHKPWYRSQAASNQPTLTASTHSHT